VLYEDIGDDHVHYKIKKGRYTLVVYATKDMSVDLPSPKDGVMNQTIKEGLSGVVEVKLYDKKALIYQGKGTSAGIEIMK
jgi:tocopherol cyclase